VLLAERVDDVPKREKTLVNLNALLEALSTRPGPLRALRACQVDKVQLGREGLAFHLSSAVISGHNQKVLPFTRHQWT
jgi:hypothetical protein